MLRNVYVESGTVIGCACSDPRITVFKGIPYAAPPIGSLRWKPPQPPVAFAGGTFRADHYGCVAPQILPGTDSNDFYSNEMYPCTDHCIPGEDCLRLNIWSPANTENDQLPVYVWIHGGGLQGGYPYEMAFDGESLARQGIILVTVGYRLGPLGFLCHKDLTDNSMPGCNFGFLDLVAALKWIQRNIRAFGGDPSRVTIGGQSGGAQCVTVLTTINETKGLFHGAVMESGGGLRAFGYGPSYLSLDEGQKRGAAFLRMLGVEQIDEARQLSFERIMEAYSYYTSIYGRMEPVLDGVMFTEDPTDTMMRNQHHHIPILLGSTTAEGYGFPAAPPLPTSKEQFKEIVRQVFDQDSEQLLQALDFMDMPRMIQLLQSDVFNFRFIASRAFAEEQARQGRTTFLYSFDTPMPGFPAAPSYHGSEMWFFFDNLPHCRRPFTGVHYNLARAMSGYLANFIRSGNVNGNDKNAEALPQWLPFTIEHPFSMIFNGFACGSEAPVDPLTRMRIDHHFRSYPYQMEKNNKE